MRGAMRFNQDLQIALEETTRPMNPGLALLSGFLNEHIFSF
ncbi:hypothetical protein NITLEN_80101 [Nitrospira lenta]|uniref:Uncharacterized protein n=1 Tax=Nitrospira lenta TaxID=1436998 RepID=A0A330LCH4_9BACT|nr:hypothetical protein NITLEN_80101 [Nitrospira lenta]